MSDRPTPETDEAQFGTGRVSVGFARKIERERDEARQKYDNLAAEHMLVVNKICGERDEAREENATLRDIAEMAIEYVGHTAVQKKLRSELDQLKEGAK
jgi:hypothetical protein